MNNLNLNIFLALIFFMIFLFLGYLAHISKRIGDIKFWSIFGALMGGVFMGIVISFVFFFIFDIGGVRELHADVRTLMWRSDHLKIYSHSHWWQIRRKKERGTAWQEN